MEEILHKFNVYRLSMKLTNENLYVNSAISSDIFPIRSLNEIALVDRVEKFNRELTRWKKEKNRSWLASFSLLLITLYFIKGLLFHDTVLTGIFGNKLLLLFTTCVFLAATLFLLFKSNKTPKPRLKSAVRIMINGRSRDFEFDKQSSNYEKVAKFVAMVERTLNSEQKTVLKTDKELAKFSAREDVQNEGMKTFIKQILRKKLLINEI